MSCATCAWICDVGLNVPPGGNGSRSLCAVGYSGVLCTVCAPGYFLQVRDARVCVCCKVHPSFPLE